MCLELNNRVSKLIMFLICVSKSSIILFRVSFGRFWWRHYRQWPTGCFKWIAICLFMQETDWNIWDLMIDSLDLDKRRFQNSIAEFSELARSSPSAELWFDSCIGKLRIGAFIWSKTLVSLTEVNWGQLRTYDYRKFTLSTPSGQKFLMKILIFSTLRNLFCSRMGSNDRKLLKVIKNDPSKP